jgi:zinc transporter ZupT
LSEQQHIHLKQGDNKSIGILKQRRKPAGGGFIPSEEQNDVMKEDMSTSQNTSWKRILLLIIAITVHNIPGIYTDKLL